MSGRTRAADEYDFIRTRMQEIASEDQRFVSPPTTNTAITKHSGAFLPVDFVFQWHNGRRVFVPQSDRARQRAQSWSNHGDGTYRKLSEGMYDKLIDEGFSIQEI